MTCGKERFAELMDNGDYTMITSFRQTYIDLLKQYYFVGGMPEAVLHFVDNQDFNKVREEQARILTAYEQDFSKHAPNEIVPRVNTPHLPLKAYEDIKAFKLFPVDVGLLGCMTGLHQKILLDLI